jgi:hypothetical protein
MGLQLNRTEAEVGADIPKPIIEVARNDRRPDDKLFAVGADTELDARQAGTIWGHVAAGRPQPTEHVLPLLAGTKYRPANE